MAKLAAFGSFLLFCCLLLALWWRYPEFWPVSAIPFFTLLVFQTVALSGSPHVDKIFNATEWVYYAIIGGVVGVGSLYVLNGGAATRLNLLLEQESLQRERTTIELQLRGVTKAAEAAAPVASDDFLKACIAAQVQERLQRPMSPGVSRGNIPVPRLDACQGYFEGLARWQSQRSDFTRLTERLSEINQRLPALQKALLENHAIPLVGQSYNDLRLQYLVIPTLVLVGVTMKLGKTTRAMTRIPG